MSNRTAGRALTAAALAALVIGSASPAGAAPRAEGPPYTAATATTILRDEDTGRTADLTVTAVKGSAARLTFNLYFPGLICTVGGEPALLTISTLESAAVTGTFTYSCEPGGTGNGIADDTLTGTAAVELVWAGDGAAHKAALDHCVGRYMVRSAVVTASVTLTGGVQQFFGYAAPDDSHLSYTQNVCPPGIK